MVIHQDDIPDGESTETAESEEDALADGLSMPEPVRVVAIGASAGGLEPIEQFFDRISIDTGLAFVIIQHLSPNFQSMMDQLIERHTNMRVQHAENGTRIQPNVIYLNPPRTALSIKDGVLQAKAYPDTDMLSLPIDAFFTSLANDAAQNAIGVVMSGTGSDGAKGSKCIIEKGGTVIAQDPETAKFQSMPHKVVENDAASFVAKVADIPEIINAIVTGNEVKQAKSPQEDEEQKTEVRILAIIQKVYGTDFRYYKHTTVNRRILRRALLKRYRNIENYYERLQTDKEELDALYCDLLIGVTEFFRDKDAFSIIEHDVLPRLISEMSEETPLRIWVPGCATGEEPYSLAILLSEYARRTGQTLNVKIFATDIHFRSLDIAARGIYDRELLQGVPEDLLNLYFTPVDDKFQVSKQLRRLIVFSQHNLIKDPPFTKIDMISCRNLLIYLNDIAQQKVLALFHFALRREGVLFLGPSETVGSLGTEFEILDKRWRVFCKSRDTLLRESTYLLPLEHRQKEQDSLTLKETRSDKAMHVKRESHTREALNLAYDRLLEKYAPTSLLISKDGDLVHVFGDSDRYLQVRKGVFSQKAIDLIHTKLRLVVNAGIERTLSLAIDQPFECSVNLELEPDKESSLNIKIDKLGQNGPNVEFILVTIEEMDPIIPIIQTPGAIAMQTDDQDFYTQRIAELEGGLKSTGESLQNTIEELETSNEELQATNEELMASNEELQSTNEELHSVNEELYTVSAEHQRKIAELTELTDDMENLLRSTQVGTLFLDDELKIRRYTPAANRAFNLLPHDIGRPIDHVTAKFASQDLTRDIHDAATAGKVTNREVEIDARTFLLTVLPYKTELGTVTGAVINVVDIHELRLAQTAHATEKEFYKTVVDSQSDLICRFRPDMNLLFANEAFSRHFGVRQSELNQTNLVDLYSKKAGKQLRTILADIENTPDIDWEMTVGHNGDSPAWYHTHLHALSDESGQVIEILSVSRNITEIKQRETLMADFNGIASDSERSLEQRIDAVLRLVSDFLEVDGAILIRRFDDVGRIQRIVNLDHIGLRFGQETPYPIDASQPHGGNMGVEASSSNFSTGTFDAHPLLDKYDYQSVAGAPIFISGLVEGAIIFAAKEAIKTNLIEAVQPVIDRIADWIGYELNRQTQTRELEALNDRLVREEERFRNLYMNTPILMYSIDQEGHIIDASNKYLSELGFDRDEVLGRLYTDFTSQMPDNGIDDYLTDLWQTGAVNAVPVQLLKKDGSTIDTLLSAIAHRDGDGTMRSMTVLVDVTDRLKAERELEAQNAELKKINDNLNQFTHIVSHDLAGPLRAVQHTASWIEEDLNPDARADIQDHIVRLKDQIMHLGSLISDLTEYSRAGAAPKDLERVPLLSMLNDIYDVIDHPKDIRFETDLVENEVVTFRPPLMLVFRNLIENAIKYHDKTDGFIKVTSEDLGDAWKFVISDDGPGIDPMFHDKIMLPFRKLERKDMVPGNGMGLALVQKAVESIGGTIEIISDPQQAPGTKFSIVWPKPAKA